MTGIVDWAASRARMVVAFVMMAAGPWLLRQITGFTTRLIENIPYLIG